MDGSPGSPAPRSPVEKDRPQRQRGWPGKLVSSSLRNNPFLAADAAASKADGGRPKRPWGVPKENRSSPTAAAAVPKRVRLSPENQALSETQNLMPSSPQPKVTPRASHELERLEEERLAAQAAVKADFAARRAVEVAAFEAAAAAAPESLPSAGAEEAAPAAAPLSSPAPAPAPAPEQHAPLGASWSGSNAGAGTGTGAGAEGGAPPSADMPGMPGIQADGSISPAARGET